MRIKKEFTEYSALEISRYLIHLAESDHIVDFTHLKLQKLLYFIQGFHLGFYKRALFNDKIEAWPYGPVIPIVYNEYKKYKGNRIPYYLGCDDDSIKERDKRFIKRIWNLLKMYSPERLSQITHLHESPWDVVLNKGKVNGDFGAHIPLELIYEYFSKEYLQKKSEHYS